MTRRLALPLLALSFCLLAPSRLWSQAAAPAAEQGFAKWEKEIAAFEAQDAEHPPEKGGIVFVGSSSIKKWKTLAEDFPHHRVLNRGFGGSEIADSVHFADRIVIPYAPRMLVLYAGGNDINKGKSPEVVFGDFRAFFEKVRAALPEAEIALISVAGNPKRWAQVEQVKAFNAMAEAYLKKRPRAHFINVFPKMLGSDGLPRPEIFSDDKLHMNAAGYALWRDIVGPFLPRADKP
jgi:lysophospholipase L1-like esterase